MLSLLIGVPIGIYSAVKQYSRFDYFFTTTAFIGSAMPTFFFALLLILLFSVFPVCWKDNVPWIPRMPPGLRVAVAPLRDRVLAARDPAQVLRRPVPAPDDAGRRADLLANMAPWSRFVRSSMLEVLRQDYVRTARAKGLFERVVIMKHALRNALIPFVTIVVLSIPVAVCRRDHHRDGVCLARHGPALLRRA